MADFTAALSLFIEFAVPALLKSKKRHSSSYSKHVHMIKFITLQGSNPTRHFTWLHPQGLVPYIWDGIFPADTSFQCNLNRQLAEPARQGYYGLNGVWDYGWEEHVLTPRTQPQLSLPAVPVDVHTWPRPASSPSVEMVLYPYQFMTLDDMAGHPIASPAIPPLQGYLSSIDPKRHTPLSKRLVPLDFQSHAAYPRCWL